MYFYIHKNNENKNKQNILLEMCSNACIRFGNDTKITILLKVAAIASATFFHLITKFAIHFIIIKIDGHV